MNIRRFAARDMREALREIRSSLGPDAVMLSSHKTAQGVEVIAAMDYDDRLLDAVRDGDALAPGGDELLDAEDSEGSRHSADQSAGPEPVTYEQIARKVQDRAPPHEPPDPEPVEHTAPLHAAVGDEVTEEIKDLRHLLETQLASLAWNDLNRRTPTRARALRQLAKIGVDADLARELADHMPASSESVRDRWRVPLQLFAGRLPLARRDLAEVGGIFAVVGPTGVGKTTSIAKIAARFALRHNVNELGLVSADNYRIGAREQLLTFARILGAPMHVAENARELRSVLDRLANKKLVLIDTAGMSQRDLRLTSQFSTLKVSGHHVYPVLTVSAAADRGSLAETLSVFQAAKPKALIITKLDEATSLGPVLSLAIRSGLPVAYVSDGQRVPEDLHLAGPKRAWLMQTVARLARDHSAPPDEDELASAFGPMELVANG